MNKIFVPEYIKSFMALLEQAGYEAYLVGGCVRDALMGNEVNDYDITTSATPDEMKKVFAGHYKIAETGIKHGTLTVISDNGIAEITTFRFDGEYTDGRHPNSVIFTKRLESDLARRDFTVNALAYSEKFGVIDYFNGISDMENKVIRAVGNPEKRFTEDALRILRGIRFSATLNFSVEKETADAMLKLGNNLDLIARERVYSEIKKTVMGKNASRVLNDFSQIISHVLKGFNKTELLGKYDGEELCVRLALISDAFKDAETAKSAIYSLKPDNKTSVVVSRLIDVIYEYDSFGNDKIIDFAVKHGLESAKLAVCVLRLKAPEIGICAERTLKEAACAGFCMELKNLKVSGRDMIKLGCPERYIGNVLEKILFLTSHGKALNEKEKLLALAVKFIDEIHE